MRRAYLYLNGERFLVAQLIIRTLDVQRKRLWHDRRSFINGWRDIELVGKVFAPPTFSLSKILSWTGAPISVKYRDMSGLFYVDADIGEAITFRAVAAGPVKWSKRGKP